MSRAAEAVVAYVGDPVTDPLRALQAAVYAARASSHSRRLEAAQQAAFHAWADCFDALIAYACVRDREAAERDRELAALRARVAAFMGEA